MWGKSTIEYWVHSLTPQVYIHSTPATVKVLTSPLMKAVHESVNRARLISGTTKASVWMHGGKKSVKHGIVITNDILGEV